LDSDAAKFFAKPGSGLGRRQQTQLVASLVEFMCNTCADAAARGGDESNFHVDGYPLVF
jgi:hypothetical protein